MEDTEDILDSTAANIVRQVAKSCMLDWQNLFGLYTMKNGVFTLPDIVIECIFHQHPLVYAQHRSSMRDACLELGLGEDLDNLKNADLFKLLLMYISGEKDVVM
jgi:hypothetical protein